MVARSRTQGFTTIELMIVVIIIGILTAIAAPNMADMIRVQRLKTAAFDLHATLVFARSEALKRNVNVTITPVNVADWTKGWLVKDANNNVLKQEADRNLGPEQLVMTGPAVVTFSRNGRLAAALPKSFSFTAPSVPPEKYRCMGVDLSGRPNSAEGACPP